MPTVLGGRSRTSQSLPTATSNIVPNQLPGCFCAQFHSLVSPYRRISWKGRTGSLHLVTHTLFIYPDLLSFLRDIFIAEHIYLFLIEFYLNSWTIWCAITLLMRSSNHKNLKLVLKKPQHLERKATRVLLPSRWASWGDLRPLSKDVLCCCWPIQRK